MTTLNAPLLPSKALKKRMKDRLVETLGQPPMREPDGAPPAFSAPNPMEAAQAAAAAVAAASPSLNALSETYAQGVHDAMRQHHETTSDTVYKRFSNHQRAAIMGWCRVRKWRQVPKIWKKIEATKSEDDLRRVLNKAWGKKTGNALNTTFFDIDWPDDMLKAIRTARPYESAEADFLTSEMGIAPMALLPRSRDETRAIQAEKRAMERANNVMTLTESRRISNRPRMPPKTWEKTCALLTTYSLLVEMLFTGEGEHAEGLDDVRRALKALSKNTDKLTPLYFANVMWKVYDDGCKYFDECVEMDDFADPRADILWPRTDLRRFSLRIGDTETIRLLTFPIEWEMALAETPRGEEEAGERGGGRSRSRGGGGAGGDPGPRAGGGGSPGRPMGRTWQQRHPDRYSPNAKNQNVAAGLRQLLAPLRQQGRLNVFSVIKAANTGMERLARWGKTPEESIGQELTCPAYACGGCSFPNCKFAHKTDSESPRGYTSWLANQLKPGVMTLCQAASGDEPPTGGGGDRRKRKRAAREGEATAGNADADPPE